MKINKLDVYLHQTLTGQLSIASTGELSFRYDESYLHQTQSPPLSFSLPLSDKNYSAVQCRPFFSGLLPEANLRSALARQLGISEKNDFSLLTALGGECAGAIALLPPSQPLLSLTPDYKVLNKAELKKVLKTMHQRPMIVGEDGLRLSLAGAQDKLPIAVIDDQIALPRNGAPSTHILKPINRDFLSLIENECFCLNLARTIGLNAVKATLHHCDNLMYLLVERYDRTLSEQGIIRLHQEDFCQALGIPPEMKYQREGGPAIKDCFNLLRKVSSLPVIDLKYLLQAILFNVIIGNNDAHGKNFSLLHMNKQIRLAPFYDLISTTHYKNLSAKMAMKIGSKYDFSRLFPRHFDQMSLEASLSPSLVRKELSSLIGKIKAAIAESPFTPDILMRGEKLLQRLQYD